MKYARTDRDSKCFMLPFRPKCMLLCDSRECWMVKDGPVILKIRTFDDFRSNCLDFTSSLIPVSCQIERYVGSDS